MMRLNEIITADVFEGLQSLEDSCIQCCITSPPYWRHRDYGFAGQLGQEETPECYVLNLVRVFEEVKRVLKPDGTLWLNLGDTYYGSNSMVHDNRQNLKPKDLIGIPWMVAFALRSSGWYLRQDIIWSKSNPLPEAANDRCSRSHELLFLLSKSPRYYFNSKIIREKAAYDGRKVLRSKGSPKYSKANLGYSGNGHPRWQISSAGIFLRNKRSVWNIPLTPFKGKHYAGFPEALPTICLLAGSKEEDVVLDPFMGSGTTALSARKLNRYFIGIEKNPEYVKLAERRLAERFNQLGFNF